MALEKVAGSSPVGHPPVFRIGKVNQQNRGTVWCSRRAYPASEFSAERAMPDLRAIAREPHPVGSPENASVASRTSRRLGSVGCKKAFSVRWV